jgi:integrase
MNMDLQILSREFCEYSVSIKGYTKKTITRYKQVIGFYGRHAGITTIHEVTPENVRSLFFYGRTQRQWTPNTFLHYHKTLEVFFRWCIKQGYMQNNPVEDIEVPKLEKKLPSKLTKQDSLRLLEVVYNYPYDHMFLRYRNHAIFSMLIHAGLRKNELLHLMFTDTGAGFSPFAAINKTITMNALRDILRLQGEANHIFHRTGLGMTGEYAHFTARMKHLIKMAYLCHCLSEEEAKKTSTDMLPTSEKMCKELSKLDQEIPLDVLAQCYYYCAVAVLLTMDGHDEESISIQQSMRAQMFIQNGLLK